MAIITDPDALPQLFGEYKPADAWQVHINKVFYGLQGAQLRDLYQTFASADYRLAHALAEDYYQKVKVRDKGLEVRGAEADPSSSEKTPHHPLVIHEWGCGNGNLAACFLSHLKALDQEGTVYPRVRFVLVDNQAGALELAKSHPDLVPHLDRVETLLADVTNLTAVQDQSVDRILCNELWSDLPSKLMLRNDSETEEEYMRPNLKEHRYAAIQDWSSFVYGFDEGNLKVLREYHPFLEDIIWEREYRKVEWKDVPLRKTITECLKAIDDQVVVPINIGACLAIQEAKRVLSKDAVGLSSFDAGASAQDVFNNPDTPCYSQIGGQYSYMVNFVLLEAVGRFIGIKHLAVEPQREFVGRALGANVVSLMDLLSTYPDAGHMKPWEQDKLILQTLLALNETYTSPYQRTIHFPLQAGTPEADRDRLRDLIRALKSTGLPDTIAYVTEEEIQAASPALEKIGYDRQAIPAALTLPPQGVDYTHLSFSPTP